MRKRLLDQLPPAVVIEDRGPPPGNPWRGYQLCLRAFTNKEPPFLNDWTHAVVIQDDALVCQNFAPAVEKIATVIPDHPVVLFCPGMPMRSRRVQRTALMKSSPFFILNRQDFLPVVAVLWPRAKADSLLAWSKDRTIPGLRPPYRSDDAVSGAWMKHTKQDVYVTNPSLVQHPDDVPPVKDGHHKARNGADKGRVAFSFCVGDPLQIEWRLGSQNPS